ncbi:hypothetical protein F2P81_004474 [Scophthalmus maximus]|uniref:Uncharacterized protein n=1 Tax=Scophthalmus maximus TaxID=52904 RepID=A0A6A4T9Q6_SCOMX|nr:hypothetical protein F2P81_004474 [Scophthalmus maximus]
MHKAAQHLINHTEPTPEVNGVAGISGLKCSTQQIERIPMMFSIDVQHPEPKQHLLLPADTEAPLMEGLATNPKLPD